MTKHLHLITDPSLTKNMISMRNCQRMGNFKESRTGEEGGRSVKRYRGGKECEVLMPPSQTRPHLLLHGYHHRDHWGSLWLQRVGVPGLSDINPLAAVLSRGLRHPRGARKFGQWMGWGNPGLWLFSNRYKTILIFKQPVQDYSISLRSARI